MTFDFHRFLSLFAFCIVTLLSNAAQAEKTHVAVAANFTAPAKEIAAAFHQETQHKAVLSFGSTGKLYAQIINGAPFEVFLSADTERPIRLENEGHISPKKRITYAVGKIALFSIQSDLIDNQPSILSKPDTFRKLALANPKTAPYGKAAAQVMSKLGVYDSLKHAFVRGENIAQTFQFVSTQNAQLGFIALSQIVKTKTGSRWIVPQNLYDPIYQDAVLLKRAENNAAAIAFFEFLQSKTVRDIIQEFGYGQK